MGWTAEVYDSSDPTTLVGTATTRRGCQFADMDNDPGSWQLQVQADHADAALLAYNRIVRLKVDGTTRFAGIVRKRNRQTVPAKGGKGAKTLTVSGPGLLALPGRAIVFPEVPVSTTAATPSPASRTFNFTSADYNDSGWSAAMERELALSNTGPAFSVPLYTGFYPNAPKEWPDPLAYWIASQADSGSPPNPAPGIWYARGVLTLAADASVRFFFSADDQVRLFVDNVLVAQETSDALNWLWRETRYVDVRMAAGSHVVAAEVTNAGWPNAITNISSLVVSAWTLNDLGEPDTNVLRTDSSWLVLPYPAEAPTMTIGEILRVLITEAQLRGVEGLAAVTLGFTDTDDTDGNPWSRVADVTLQVGANYLDVFRLLVGLGVDVAMAPDLELRAWNDRGTDLSAGVTLAQAVNVGALTHDGEGPSGTVALVQFGSDARWIEVDDPVAVAASGRIEVGISMGNAPSVDAVRRFSDEIFAELGYEVDEADLTLVVVPGGPVPYTDFEVADLVDMTNSSDSEQPTRVRGIGAKQTKNDRTEWAVRARQISVGGS